MSSADSTRQIGLVLVVALGLALIIPLVLGGMWTVGGGMRGGGFGSMMSGPAMGSSDGATVPGWVVAVALLVRLLWLVAIVAGGYLLYRVFARPSRDDSAIEELRLAYARGDLSDEEYERRRERLRAED
jgi:putative membrane protein